MPSSLLISQWLFAPLLLLLAATADGDDPSKKRHAAILARVLSYELTLADRAGSSVGLAVVYKPGDAASEANARDWYAAVQDLTTLQIKGKPFFAVKIPFVAKDVISAIDKDGVDVLLIADGLAADAPAIVGLSRSKKVLTASNDAALIQQGLTVCVADQDSKLKVIINLKGADQEGIRFSSSLLRLATIVR